jgi:hypothetical protein
MALLLLGEDQPCPDRAGRCRYAIADPAVIRRQLRIEYSGERTPPSLICVWFGEGRCGSA